MLTMVILDVEAQEEFDPLGVDRSGVDWTGRADMSSLLDTDVLLLFASCTSILSSRNCLILSSSMVKSFVAINEQYINHRCEIFICKI